MIDEFIERRIVIGLIVSTEFHQTVDVFWDSDLIESPSARMLSVWCRDHYEKYKVAPKIDVQRILEDKKKQGMSEERFEDVQSILDSMSEDFLRDKFNVQYLLDQTKEYFRQRTLQRFADKIQISVGEGDLVAAEEVATKFTSLPENLQFGIEPFSSATRIKQAFEDASDPIVSYPKALGQFLNPQLVRDGFVAFLAPEKRGKTFLLMDVGIRAIRSGCNVAIFQAGDMSESQFLRRLSVYLAHKSDQERYCQGNYIPVVDCIDNQIGVCSSQMQACPVDKAPFGGYTRAELEAVSAEDLIHVYEKNKYHKTCRDCRQLKGTPWFRYIPPTEPLDWREAARIGRKFLQNKAKRMKLVTYANETLCMDDIRSILDIWERQDNFVVDVLIIDYADILAPDSDSKNLDHRNQINRVWQRMRKLSQEKHCLLVTATQAAASSYDKVSVGKRDFSEDKRKYAHVTAIYGMNQTDEEKKIGILRLGEIMVREGDYDAQRQVKILQRLQIGRPVIGSFF